MYTLLVLTCLHAAFVTTSTLPSGVGLVEPDTLEEPPHVFVMDMSKDGPTKQTFLTTRQKVLFHPKIQDMLMDKLSRDMMESESEQEDRDVVPKMLPLGFIPPRVLVDWGIDWDELAKEGDYDSVNDTEKALESLLMEGKGGQNQQLGKTDNNVWSLSFWHPSALLADTEQERDEE